MKLHKIITLSLYFVIIVSPVFSQEKDGADIDRKPVSEETVISEEVSEETAVSEENLSSDSTPEKPAEKTPEKKREEVKETPKPRVAKQTDAGVEKKAENPSPEEPLLLGIDEGNFKYSRIPEIGLNEVKAPVASALEGNSDDTDTAGLPDESETEEGGFLGMKKSTADVVAKGGILLLILIIFVLYKSRMKGTGKKGPGRNVLNSYRK